MPNLTIAGHSFEIADDPRFVPGATIELDEGTASTLQQVRRENLRNNFAPKVKAVTDALPEGADLSPEKTAELQAALDEYAAKYSFGVRAANGTRKVSDPIEREALKLAREAIADAYFAKYKTKLTGADLASKAEELLAARHDDYMKRARRNIRDRETAAAAILEAA